MFNLPYCMKFLFCCFLYLLCLHQVLVHFGLSKCTFVFDVLNIHLIELSPLSHNYLQEPFPTIGLAFLLLFFHTLQYTIKDPSMLTTEVDFTTFGLERQISTITFTLIIITPLHFFKSLEQSKTQNKTILQYLSKQNIAFIKSNKAPSLH